MWLVVGINLIAGIILGLSYSGYFTINYNFAFNFFAFLSTIPLIASAFLLNDAFNRFKTVKSKEQVVNKLLVVILTFGFVSYSLCFAADKFIALFKLGPVIIFKMNYYVYEVVILAYWSSNLFLALVLY